MGRYLALLLCGLILVNCSSREFIEGSYDDVASENNLNDKWSETDMQKAVTELVGKMVNTREIAESRRPPILMVTRLQNKTSEVIDTQNIMDMVRIELTSSGRVKFVDKLARTDVAEEYKYQNSGMVSETTKKSAGGQIGADFIVNGRLDSIVQQAGGRKSVYYKLTLNMTNLRTNVIEWAGQKQLRKKYRKKRVGW